MTLGCPWHNPGVLSLHAVPKCCEMTFTTTEWPPVTNTLSLPVPLNTEVPSLSGSPDSLYNDLRILKLVKKVVRDQPLFSLLLFSTFIHTCTQWKTQGSSHQALDSWALGVGDGWMVEIVRPSPYLQLFVQWPLECPGRMTTNLLNHPSDGDCSSTSHVSIINQCAHYFLCFCFPHLYTHALNERPSFIKF